MILQRGIEANPENIKAVFDMQHLSIVKIVQRLTSREVTLNRFMFRLANRCLSFFRLFKKIKFFEWIKECHKTFNELKKHLSSLPLLAWPKPRDELHM